MAGLTDAEGTCKVARGFPEGLLGEGKFRQERSPFQNEAAGGAADGVARGPGHHAASMETVTVMRAR